MFMNCQYFFIIFYLYFLKYCISKLEIQTKITNTFIVKLSHNSMSVFFFGGGGPEFIPSNAQLCDVNCCYDFVYLKIERSPLCTNDILRDTLSRSGLILGQPCYFSFFVKPCPMKPPRSQYVF